MADNANSTLVSTSTDVAAPTSSTVLETTSSVDPAATAAAPTTEPTAAPTTEPTAAPTTAPTDVPTSPTDVPASSTVLPSTSTPLPTSSTVVPITTSEPVTTPLSTTTITVVTVESTIFQTATSASGVTSTSVVTITSTLPGQSTNGHSSKGGGGLSTGGTIAIAVIIPIVAIAALILFGLWFWRRRRALKSSEEERKNEMAEYGFNPNNDPSLAPTLTPYGDDVAEAPSDNGYRGWGATSSNHKPSTTVASSHRPNGKTGSDGGSQLGAPYQSSPHGTGISDTYSADPLMTSHPESHDGVAALGGAATTGAVGLARHSSSHNSDIRRGPSNASSAYSAGAPQSEASSDRPEHIPHPFYGEEVPYNVYNDASPTHGPYGDGSYGGGVTQPVILAISKALSYLLRHAAQRDRVPIDSHGYVRLDHALAWPRLRTMQPRVDAADLIEVVRSSDKARFGLNGQDTDPTHFLIRATQGHSMAAVADENLLTPLVAILHSGGLKAMGRNHVHFSTGPSLDAVLDALQRRDGSNTSTNNNDDGQRVKGVSGSLLARLMAESNVRSGMRPDAQILIYIDVRRAENGVILSQGDGPDGLVDMDVWDTVVEVKEGLGVLWKRGQGVVRELPAELKAATVEGRKGSWQDSAQM
ncbi:hypothetical protein DV735_g4292, partial [Chaetothyriales sp. CBS 134920]